MLDSLTNLVVGLLAFGFLAWYFGRRWKAAGEQADAIQRHDDLTEQDFAAIKADPRLLDLLARVNGVSTDGDSPNAQRLLYAKFAGARGELIPVSHANEAPWLIAYVAGPKGRRQISLNLGTQEISDQELGGVAARMVLPHWVR